MASNSSKTRAASNNSGTRQFDRSIGNNTGGMPQANTVITISKQMVSTKLNGLSNLNVIKKKSIKTRKGGTRHESKISFTGESSISKRITRSIDSRCENSGMKSMNETITKQSPVLLRREISGRKLKPLSTQKSPETDLKAPEDLLANFHSKMSRTLSTSLDVTDRPDIKDPL